MAAPMGELVAGIIDVFANAPLAGKRWQGVQGADDLTDAEMRRVQPGRDHLHPAQHACRLEIALVYSEWSGGGRGRTQSPGGVALAWGAWRSRSTDDGADIPPRDHVGRLAY
ncbi:hypothetical protein LQT97_12555 [Brucella pseudogrignonensis]|uniref:hypothetical protein n=1 Tax=Brucella pseudogrignonensis TaxID=419475 RepID=UPI001E309FF7|nr:hypothetical protein [Brucella pseudogrignonensis]MCD4512062.1 hypothetical protein [Brucella pseudogrignonensis]